MNAANAAPAAAPISEGEQEDPPVVGAGAAGDLPAGEGTQGQEGAVREVQHAHQPVDQGQAGGHEEVQRTEAEAGEQQQDEGAHRAAPFSAGSAAGSPAGSSVGSGVAGDTQMPLDQRRRHRGSRGSSGPARSAATSLMSATWPAASSRWANVARADRLRPRRRGEPLGAGHRPGVRRADRARGRQPGASRCVRAVESSAHGAGVGDDSGCDGVHQGIRRCESAQLSNCSSGSGWGWGLGWG